MLWSRFPMFVRCARWALLALGTGAVAACGQAETTSTDAAAATARALVRPHVARNALAKPVTRDASGATVTPGPTAVVLGHRAADGTLRVGCVDSEDGAEALVRQADEEQ